MDARLTTALAVLGGTALLGFGLADGTDAGVAATEASAVRAAPVATAPAALQQVGPDTTGAAVWEHLQEVDYRDEWELWPGTTELYEGGEPHGLQLTTYVNDRALEALEAGRTVMPAGAMIVKENFTPEEELASVTVMYKVPEFNPEHGDWFFSKYLPDGEVDRTPEGQPMEGEVAGCQNCHSLQEEADYLYTERP